MVGVVQRFIEALSKLEREGELEDLLALFAPDCELENSLSSAPAVGIEGARRFFQQYRQSFGEVCSTYRAIIAGEGQAALEWTSVGRSREGEPFSYRGVTVLDFAGARISRLAAYFDPSELQAIAPQVHGQVHPTFDEQPELH